MVKQITILAIFVCMFIISTEFSHCSALTLEEQAAARAKIAELQAEKTDLQHQIDVNNQTIGANLAKIVDLGIQIKALDIQQGSSVSVNGMVSVPTDIEAGIKMASMGDDIERLKKQNKNLNAQNQSIQSQIDSIDAEIIKQENILATPTKQELQETLAQEENTLKSLEADLSRLKARNGSPEDISSAEWILEQQRIRANSLRKQIQDGDFRETGEPASPAISVPAPTTVSAPVTQVAQEESDGFCMTAIAYFPEPNVPPPTQAQDEDPEVFKARKQAYVNSLSLSDVTFKTAQQKPMVICIGSEAESAFSKESFQSGGEIALPLNLTYTDESGVSRSLSGAFLLTVDKIFENSQQASAAIPQNKPGDKSQVIMISDASGSFSIKDEKGSAQGNLVMGWSEENKEKALALAKELMMMCFIATAVYGDEHAPQVETLRQFRDEYLLCTPEGRNLIEFYYAHGPQWAYNIREHGWIIPLIRCGLDEIIAFLVKTNLHYPIFRWCLQQGVHMTNYILNIFNENIYRDPKAEAYSHLRSIIIHEKRRNKQSE